MWLLLSTMFMVTLAVDLRKSHTSKSLKDVEVSEQTKRNSTVGNILHAPITSDNVTNRNTATPLKDQNAHNDTDYDDYGEDDLEVTLMDHSIWVTSVPGVICNSITIVVVSKIKPFSPNNLFILVLGVTDLINVVSRIASVSFYFLDSISEYVCKIIDFVVINTFNYSNMILVCWTVERFIAVWFPIKYKIHCTFMNTMIVLLATGVAVFLLGVPYITDTYVYITDSGFVMCEYSKFLYNIWIPVESSYYIWLPMVTIFVFNILIVKQLLSKGHLGYALSSDRAEQRANEQRKTAKILVSVSVAFFILHLPQAIVTVYLSVTSGKLETFLDDPFGPLKSLRWAHVITEFQNSVNFFLYCLAGRQFRGYVYKLFCGCQGADKPNDGVRSDPKDSG